MGEFDAIILIYIISGIVGWLAFAAACAWLAKQRGRDWLTWGAVGLLLGILGLIILIASPSKKDSK